MYWYQSLQLWGFKLKAWRDTITPKGECQLSVLFPALSGVAQSVLHPLFLPCDCLISVLQTLAHLEAERGRVGESFGFTFLPIPVLYLLPGDVLVERSAVTQPAILHLRLCWGLRFKTGALGAALPSWATAPFLSSKARPVLTYSLQSPTEPFPGLWFQCTCWHCNTFLDRKMQGWYYCSSQSICQNKWEHCI